MNRRTEPVESERECTECRNTVSSTDEFCPYCGFLFVRCNCHTHRSRTARAACIICCLPYCKDCGSRVDEHFLCTSHQNYEIVQRMVRVFGTRDAISAEHAKSSLDLAGLHPCLFSRVSPRGSRRFTHNLFKTGTGSNQRFNDEIKILVPCQEVTAAETILRKLMILVPTKTY